MQKDMSTVPVWLPALPRGSAKSTTWSLAAIMAFFVLTFTFDKAQATIIDNVGPNNQLNKIEQAGNPSNGLHYLDSSLSSGMTLTEALAVTVDGYDIRLATQQEWSDLATAGGLILDNGLLLGDVAFGPPSGTISISTGSNYDDAIFDAIENNFGSSLRLWTDAEDNSTYDMARFFTGELIVNGNNAIRNTGSLAGVSWLLVGEERAAQGSDWNGKFDGKTKATGWKASMVRTFDASQLVDTIPGVVATWDWATPNTIQTSDCTFLAASIQSKPGKEGKFMLSGLSCPDRPSLPTQICVEVVGISAIARFEDTKKGGEEERPCVFASSDVAGDVSQTRNVAVLCPVDASKGMVKCSLPPVADNPCVDDKGKPTNDINTQLVDAVVYDNDDIVIIDIPIGNDVASLASCDTGDNKPMARIGTFINAK